MLREDCQNARTGVTESETEGSEGLRVKVRGEGLRVKWTVLSGVESGSGRGFLGCFVAHETVREN